ncbi:MAG: radical SAM protein, partial [Candidatus Omnitrophica bacterium]|nr:radical SAM protein [Candidatus Omnitrophota bacterium]
NLPAKRFRYTSLGVLPPLGVAYLASALLEGGHNVDISDIPASDLSLEDFRRLIRHKKSRIYGISSTLFGFQDVINFSEAIKGEVPGALIVLGGLCTVLPAEDILKNIPAVDIVIPGEGEEPLRQLCEIISCDGDLKEAKGIFFRGGGGDFCYSGKTQGQKRDYFPAYSLLDMKKYYLHPPFGVSFPVASMETSRGCPFGCRFCCLSKSYRPREIERVIEEMVYLKQNYGVNEIYFVDHTFTISAERISALCRAIIKRGIKIVWSCKTRIDLVSGDLLRRMRKAGCYMISYGVESGSEKILKNLNKGISVKDIENTMSLTRKYGIRSVAYMIVGSPGETRETIKESLALIKRIKPDYVLYNALAPDPGSELFSDAVNNKIVEKDFFKNAVFSGEDKDWPLYSTPEFSSSDVEFWVKKGTREFYFNIPYVFRSLARIRSMNELKIILRGARILLSDIFFGKDKYLIN